VSAFVPSQNFNSRLNANLQSARMSRTPFLANRALTPQSIPEFPVPRAETTALAMVHVPIDEFHICSLTNMEEMSVVIPAIGAASVGLASGSMLGLFGGGFGGALVGAMVGPMVASSIYSEVIGQHLLNHYCEQPDRIQLKDSAKALIQQEQSLTNQLTPLTSPSTEISDDKLIRAIESGMVDLHQEPLN